MTALDVGTDARAAARARLEIFAGRLDRLGVDDFRQMALSAGAAQERGQAREAAESAAARAGLARLAAEARDHVRDHLDRVYDAGAYNPTWVALNWGLSMGPVEDRVAAAAAVEDAALAAIVDGLVPDEVVAELAGPFELIAGAHPPRPGGTALPTPSELRGRGPLFAAVTGALVLIVVVAGIGVGLIGVAVVLAVAAIFGVFAARRPARDTD